MLNIAYRALRPLLFQLPPEVAHSLMLGMWRKCAALGAARFTAVDAAPVLKTALFGKTLPHPIGLAAGFDKNATWIAPLLQLGFSAIEVGTVTPLPQRGNPKPRLFRWSEAEALINRMGFNNQGLAALKSRLETLPEAIRSATVQGSAGPIAAPCLLGVNIGKGVDTDPDSAIDDYQRCFQELSTLADYVVINVSSPNTPGLSALQHKTRLAPLCERLSMLREGQQQADLPYTPLLIKVSSDLDPKALSSVAQIALQYGWDGVIAVNTTTARPPHCSIRETGGLSGRPLFAQALQSIRVLDEAGEGKLTLIGVGGISSAADALAMLKSGATLLQVYTALVYQGPLFVKRLVADLATLLKQERIPALSALRRASNLETRAAITS